MGLSSGLHDVSGAAPLPLLLLTSFASALASLFPSSALLEPPPRRPPPPVSPGLASLVALTDYLTASRVSTADGTAADGDCTVCLSAIVEGERVRTLACRHAFHAACLDGWFDQSSLSCPLCRAGPTEQDDGAGRRIGEEAAAWFARF